MFNKMFQNLKEAVKEGVIIRKQAVKAVKESTKRAVIRVNGKLVSEHKETIQSVIREDETIQTERVVTSKKVEKSVINTVVKKVFNVLCLFLTLFTALSLIAVGIVGLKYWLIIMPIAALIVKAQITVCKRNNWL